jgi:hypothetical protein
MEYLHATRSFEAESPRFALAEAVSSHTEQPFVITLVKIRTATSSPNESAESADIQDRDGGALLMATLFGRAR